MSLESSPGIETPPFFTYFRDTTGIIYYSHGYKFGSFVSGTCVYVPAGGCVADRSSLVDKMPYVKYLDHGDGIDINKPGTNIDREYLDLLISMRNNGQFGPTGCLLVPEVNISTVFNPNNLSLIKRAHPQIEDVIQGIIADFQMLGIPEADIGLCGALQAQILNNGDSQYRDVDLLITGEEHFPTIAKMARERNLQHAAVMLRLHEQVERILSHRPDWSEFRPALAHRNSRMAIPTEDGARILDIKIRKRSLPTLNLLQNGPKIQVSGVVQGDGSCTLPGEFSILMEEG